MATARFMETWAHGQDVANLGEIRGALAATRAVVARAAQAAELWPHAAALAWQALWVWLTVALGARLFRRNVLKSGGAARTMLGRKKKA